MIIIYNLWLVAKNNNGKLAPRPPPQYNPPVTPHGGGGQREDNYWINILMEASLSGGDLPRQ